MLESTLVSRLVSLVEGSTADSPALRWIEPSTSTIAELTYRELAGRAGGIAAALTAVTDSDSAQHGRRVGVLAETGAAAVTGVLGVLAAGAAYVPLDPTYPRARLVEWIRQADLAAIVTRGAWTDLAAEVGAGLPVVDIESVGTADLAVPSGSHPDDVAYLLATSGSTGAPKGVAQLHRNVLACADNQIGTLRLGPDDAVSLLASLSFDAAVPDLYGALFSGAVLCPVDVRTGGLLGAVDALQTLGVSVLHTTPTVFRHLVTALGTRTLPQVRAVLLGGEAAGYDDLRRAAGRFGPRAVLVNGYGSTEATFSAQQQFPIADPPADAIGLLPIGHPLPGFDLTVRDESGRPAAAVGEIVVRSPHVAPGYWRDTELSAERFGVDPDGVPTYRTGDLGRRLPDDSLVCLGRLDRQVKVRGFRIEPAEVEAALATVPGVRQTVVVGRDDRLIAYVDADHACPAPDDLIERLRTTLPDYLVPDAVVMVDSFPLTPTGKIDVLALDPAMPPTTAGEGSALSGDAVADRTADTAADTVADRVAAAWASVLPTYSSAGDIPTDLGFFDAGGTSLTVGLLQVALADSFGRDVPLTDLFQHPTISSQARIFASSPAPDHDAAIGPESGIDAGPALDDEFGVDELGAEDLDADELAVDELGVDDDAIAIIGMAGRFPGADDIDTFWANLCAGVDAIHDYTDDELDGLGIGADLRADPAYVRAGGQVAGVTDFDAGFFRMTQQEAERTDPQHRLFLEAAWSALEDGGVVPDRFDGRIGVFAAASVSRYFLFHLLGNPALDVNDPDDWEGMLAGAHQSDHLPGQVAYRLGLTGPAVSVQCACSSSLAAVAMAAQNLLDLRCDVALAGGVNVTWPRYRYQPGGLGSPDGRCRAFDADAQGAGFSSGVGVVALKRLADAEADGDHVHAVIRGWAVTNDGSARAGFAAPGAAGQAEAIAEALAVAGIAPEDVGLVEGHGSGTPLGDAIEVSALTQVYRDGGAPADQGIALSSVKTNIGHLDAAAGIAGLIKAVLAVRHGVIPATVHFRAANPELALDRSPFRIPATTEPWIDDRPRVAAVNSFGVGGTNVHMLVEEAGRVDEPADVDVADAPWVLPLSAPDPHALRDLARNLRRHLDDHPQLRPCDVTRTLTVGRRWWPHRAVASGRTLAAAMDDLARIAAGQPPLACTSMDAAFVRWSQGEDVDVAALVAGRTVPLPTYPFQRRRAWIEPIRGALV